MNNLFMFCLFVWLAGNSLSFILEGQTGVGSTILTASLTETSSTIAVHSTQGFLDSDFVLIGTEDICYTGITATTFTGLTRGCNDTATGSHNSGVSVYSESTGFINKALGFNIQEVFSDGGVIGFAKGVYKSVGHALDFLRLISRMITWDYAYLEGNGIYIKMFLLYPISGGLVFGLVRMALGR